MLLASILLLAARAAMAALPEPISCELAHQKCAYRKGCGSALQHYLMGCAGALEGGVRGCPEQCQLALTSLTSTPEGQDLISCTCSDTICADTKRRVEVCRPSVEHLLEPKTVVSCDVAQLICESDPVCNNAFFYYQRNCRSMVTGRRCSTRCKNSISILQRQEKAAKLATCRCVGYGAADCRAAHQNRERLCYPQHATPPPEMPQETPPAPPNGSSVTAPWWWWLTALLCWLAATRST